MSLKVYSIMGFWYSGSSALYDHALEHSGVGYVANPSKCDETVFSHCGITDLFSDTRKATVEEVVSRLKGEEAAFFPKPHMRRRARYVYNSLRPFGLDRAIQEIENADRKCQNSLLAACRRFYEIVFEILPDEFFNGGSKEAIVFNNDPSARNIERVVAVPDAFCTAVIRDPRDQYVDILKHYKSRYKVSLFIRALRQSYEDFFSALKVIEMQWPDVYKNIRCVEFERFVCSEKTRESWREFCQLDAPIVSQRFHPERSRQNIGIGSELSHKVQDRINSEFRDIRNNLNQLLI